MSPLVAFGIGCAFGFIASVVVAAILTARGVYPHDERFDDEPGGQP